MRKMILAFDTVYIVMDALDEAHAQEEALNFIRWLNGMDPGRLGLLVLSREDRQLQRMLKDFGGVEMAIGPDTIEEDVRQHVKQRLAHDGAMQRWPEAIRMDIEATLMRGAQGM